MFLYFFIGTDETRSPRHRRAFEIHRTAVYAQCIFFGYEALVFNLFTFAIYLGVSVLLSISPVVLYAMTQSPYSPAARSTATTQHHPKLLPAGVPSDSYRTSSHSLRSREDRTFTYFTLTIAPNSLPVKGFSLF